MHTDPKIITRATLLGAPERPWQAVSTYHELFIIPSRLKHDSGWMRMIVVGKKEDGSLEQCVWGDDLCWKINTSRTYSMRSDCTYPGGILHFWGARFTVGHSLSSTDITVTDAPRG